MTEENKTQPKPKGRAPKYPLHELLVNTAEGRKTESPLHTAFALAHAFKAYCAKHNIDAASTIEYVLLAKPWEHDAFKEMCEAFNIRLVDEER